MPCAVEIHLAFNFDDVGFPRLNFSASALIAVIAVGTGGHGSNFLAADQLLLVQCCIKLDFGYISGTQYCDSVELIVGVYVTANYYLTVIIELCLAGKGA